MKKVIITGVYPDIGRDAKLISKRINKIINFSRPKIKHLIILINFMNSILPKLVPDRLLDKIMGKQLELIKK